MQQRAVGLLLWAPQASDIRSIAARLVCSRRGRVSIHIHSSTAVSSKCEQRRVYSDVGS